MSEPVPLDEILPEVMSNIRKRMHHNKSQKKPHRRVRRFARRPQVPNHRFGSQR